MTLQPGTSYIESGSRDGNAGRKRIVVIGASGHARVVLDVCAQQGSYEIAGLVDTYKPAGTQCGGYPVIGGTRELPVLLDSESLWGGIVAIGDNWIRRDLVSRIREMVPGFRFATLVHPSAQIAADVTIGQGSVVMAGAIINPGSVVGDFCIVNTRASVDHECVLSSYSSIGPGAVLGGCVRVGAYSAVGIGAVVLQEIEIGEQVVVGAGSTVLRNIPGGVVAYGTPARVIRPRRAGERYLGDRKGGWAGASTT